MIELINVSHVFGDKPVLNNLSVQLIEQRIGIIGSNGGGKSTFARLLNALLIPAQGQVLVEGVDTRQHAKQVRQQVGFVFQNPDNQIVLPTVLEDLAFGMKNLKLNKELILQKSQTLLQQYGLWEHREAQTYLLSGGQKQLLAILGVLAMEPNYIVFDEPTTLLDLRNKRKIKALIESLSQTIIMVTHDLSMLDQFDRVLWIDEGRIVMDGTPESVLPIYEKEMI